MRCQSCGCYIAWDLSLGGLCWPCADALDLDEPPPLTLEPPVPGRSWQDVQVNPRFL